MEFRRSLSRFLSFLDFFLMEKRLSIICWGSLKSGPVWSRDPRHGFVMSGHRKPKSKASKSIVSGKCVLRNSLDSMKAGKAVAKISAIIAESLPLCIVKISGAQFLFAADMCINFFRAAVSPVGYCLDNLGLDFFTFFNQTADSRSGFQEEAMS